jgi:uncharacterized membrane protein
MAETNPAPRKAWPWARIVLAGSLAVNLLVIGLIAGALLGGPRDRDRNPVLRDLGFGPFVQALPRADRRELGAAMRREAGAFRENRAEMRRQFEAILAALRADPFDAGALRDMVEAQYARVSERQGLGRRLLLDRIEAMTGAERAAYADALDASLRRRRPDRSDRD